MKKPIKFLIILIVLVGLVVSVVYIINRPSVIKVTFSDKLKPAFMSPGLDSLVSTSLVIDSFVFTQEQPFEENLYKLELFSFNFPEFHFEPNKASYNWNDTAIILNLMPGSTIPGSDIVGVKFLSGDIKNFVTVDFTLFSEINDEEFMKIYISDNDNKQEYLGKIKLKPSNYPPPPNNKYVFNLISFLENDSQRYEDKRRKDIETWKNGKKSFYAHDFLIENLNKLYPNIKNNDLANENKVDHLIGSNKYNTLEVGTNQNAGILSKRYYYRGHMNYSYEDYNIVYVQYGKGFGRWRQQNYSIDKVKINSQLVFIQSDSIRMINNASPYKLFGKNNIKYNSRIVYYFKSFIIDFKR